MIYTLGQPADHLLNNGLHTDRYFIYTESKTWMIKVNPKDSLIFIINFISILDPGYLIMIKVMIIFNLM